MVQNIPFATAVSHLKRSWTANGKIFQGVAVFQYCSVQPAPGGLTHWTISGDDMSRWGASVDAQAQEGRFNAQRSWDRSRLTLSAGSSIPSSWPDVLHSREPGQQESPLQQCNINLWRSVWLIGKGLDQLNKDYVQTDAIAFELTAPVTVESEVAQAGDMEELLKKTIAEAFEQGA